MMHQLRKLLFCCMAIQLILMAPSMLYAAACSNNWLRPSSQTMETEIMTASMIEYANGEKYFSMKQGWKTIHVYYLLGAVLVKGLDDKEIDFNNVFLYPMVFMQGGVLSKAFPQGPCSINKKTPIALPEAEGEIDTTLQGVIAYKYRLTGQANVKYFKGVVKYTLPETAPSDDTVLTGYKLIGITKPYPVVGGKEIPATTIKDFRRVMASTAGFAKKEQAMKDAINILRGHSVSTPDTMKPEDVILAREVKTSPADSNELYPLQIGNLFGYVNKAGSVVIEPRFNLAFFFEGNVARIHINYKWGVIDKTGRFVIEPQYKEIGPFRDGLACVRKDGKVGFINEKGKIIVAIENDCGIMPEYEKGVVAFHDSKDKIYYFDKNGNSITKEQFWEAREYNKSKILRPMQKDGKWGLLSVKNEVILEPTYNYDHINNEKDGLFLVKKNDQYGFIDRTGKLVIDLQFEHAYDFEDGLAGAKKNGKYGFIDKTGRFVIKPQFDSVRGFEDGIAPIMMNKKWGLIDKIGHYIVNPQFEYTSFRYGIGTIEKNGKSGLVDRTGKVIIEPIFDGRPWFTNGLGAYEYAIVRKGLEQGVINKSGKIIIPIQSSIISMYPNPAQPNTPTVIRVTGLSHEGYADTSGNLFIMTDKVCGQHVVKNRKGEITWPRNIKELCRQ